MFCTKCGGDNSDTAVYCRKCGAALDEEETRVARRDDINFAGRNTGEYVERLENREDTTVVRERNREAANDEEADAEIFSIGPTLMFVKIGYVAAAIGALILVALSSALFSSWIPVWLSIFVGLLLLLIPAYHHFQQKLVHYTLTETTLRIEAGLFSRTTRNVPVTRIQDVTVSATPWQRLLGIGDLIFDNASEQGGKRILKNINTPKKYADKLLKQMRLLEK